MSGGAPRSNVRPWGWEVAVAQPFATVRSLRSLTTAHSLPHYQHDQADTKDLSSSSKFSASCVLGRSVPFIHYLPGLFHPSLGMRRNQ